MNPNIIAEIGINHEGSVAKAMQLIQEIADAGLEYVKFQIYDLDYFKDDPHGNTFDKFQLPFSDYITLIDEAHIRGLKWGASTFGDGATRFVLHQNPDFFKVSSRRAGDKALAQQLLAAGYTDKPVLVSHGMYWDERSYDIWECLNAYHLLCVSKYPAEPHNIRMDAYAWTGEQMEIPLGGYSDHCIGTDAVLVSGILGAEWIEKHIRLEYQTNETPDIVCSVTAAELAAVRDRIIDLRRYL